MFTKEDLTYMTARGNDPEVVARQIGYFQKGIPAAKLVQSAIIGDGLLAFDTEETIVLCTLYDQHYKSKEVVKFVPASGAASRMFKSFFAFLESGKVNTEIEKFILEIERFPFYQILCDLLTATGTSMQECLEKKDYKTIVGMMLAEDKMNYGLLPKGLILFHSYPDGVRTPAGEHLEEGAVYCADKDGVVRIHFTVPGDMKSEFQAHVDREKPSFELNYNVKYEIGYSVQLPSTDTIAVDMDNHPFRKDDGNLLFRPGGHGALLENLNACDADMIFIKNVDNVVHDKLKAETYLSKKMLGGLMIKLQHQVFAFLSDLEKGGCSDRQLNVMLDFAVEHLKCFINPDVKELSAEQKASFLKELFNRPIRICGMVLNEGEPGGGPFLVEKDGRYSWQIVETAQVNLSDAQQKEVLESSTHFSPTDLVCGIRNYKGQKFDLRRYVDPDAGFITNKSQSGRDLKALELPGLWNGSMADWITIFVEIPVRTFNPVKSVTDLLRDPHQP